MAEASHTDTDTNIRYGSPRKWSALHHLSSGEDPSLPSVEADGIQSPKKREREKVNNNAVTRNGTTSAGSVSVGPAKKVKRYPLHVEAIVHPACPTPIPQLRREIEKFVSSIGQSSFLYTAGPVDLSTASADLRSSCVEVSIVDIVNHDNDADDMAKTIDQVDVQTSSIAYWNVSSICVHAYTLSDEDAELEELDNADDEEELSACETLPLPHSSLHSLWEHLILPKHIKRNLLEYAHSALLFSDRNVSPHVISWNRVILLHGPPGTGKTSLARALAHKLTIRMSNRFHSGFLLEIHSHSLFSKWFSESGKLVSRLFQRIREMVEDDPDALFCVLADEVESLAASRIGGGGISSSGEPSDAIRAVNSLLTSIDRLRRYKNVIVMTTTNITGSVDVAFVDRADIKQYIGLPVVQARYEILRSCVSELIRVGIIDKYEEGEDCTQLTSSVLLLPYQDAFLRSERELEETTGSAQALLLECAELADGLSGRSLRKLPFQSHALFVRSADATSLVEFLIALRNGIKIEQEARKLLKIEEGKDSSKT